MWIFEKVMHSEKQESQSTLTKPLSRGAIIFMPFGISRTDLMIFKLIFSPIKQISLVRRIVE